MGWFQGLLLGSAVTLLICGAVGTLAYRRFLSLRQKIRHSEHLAELGMLTGGLAHEIRNPLATLQLNLQLLQEEIDRHDDGSGRATSRLSRALKETNRLRDILEDFLRYAGRFELEKAPLDLVTVLQELADFLAPQAMAQKVQIRVTPSAGPVVAQVDQKLIRQALLNLMLNAIQVMPTGGELILSARSERNHAVLDVIDTGPGIAAGELDRIFQAYYSKRKGGTGLGLAMTRRIVEEHGGTISVTSEPGKGSDFRIRLPAGAN
jgi:signal transduction histidine kinase